MSPKTVLRRSPWLFPVPVRQSGFVTIDTKFSRFNIEAAPDLIDGFSFATAPNRDVLLYDLQTQLHGNYAGRHGSGRSGIYLGHYLKGIGRTPAAANWNNNGDIYHASGHLSVASAIRERVITVFLQARGLANTIVPCQSVLVRHLSVTEARAIRRNQSSSRPEFARCDGAMIALTVKPANFARMSNFVFALDHSPTGPKEIGELFLDLECYLHPPGDRDKLEGKPNAIVRALETAFERGLKNFEAFARIGLHWLFLNSNFSLDGRFFDLETPLFFGASCVAISIGKSDGKILRELIGFEEFGFVLHWRLFIAWLKSRLRFLLAPEISHGRFTRPFLRDLYRNIEHRFSDRHLLYRDAALISRASANLSEALGLNRVDQRRLTEFARTTFEWRVYDARPAIPKIGWQPIGLAPAPATPFRRQFKAAPFIHSPCSRDGQAFARAVAHLGSLCDPKELLQSLENAASFFEF